ncbi:glycosyltransferase involved in cell wall biogenesis [Rubidibacter lacunae KORDI 51-2]|uniref:Glycosyltransferase involved in cell wall biogenesis n=1 Tax=Rubidibacter lacunae KORDI 51-2 TaxID=582515 RepID=U5DPW6_9CHRO|nr:glycosyltransferase [Rubidibacter lacunae]ERN41745.1 glycosyltransferase involved in cell wall biogenesis [Rubidibacter lacunae KORDI 51-2]
MTVIRSPLISVVMSVYRQPHEWLSAAIASILNQTLEDFEFIVLLDAPDDAETAELVQKFSDRDRRIRLSRNQCNLGLALSLNRGFAMARGKYFARMDSDDISERERLQVQYEYLEAHPKIDLVGSQALYIDSEAQPLGLFSMPTDPRLARQLVRFRSIAIHPTWFFRSHVWHELNGYRKFPTSQDYDFLYRAIDAGLTVANLDRPLLHYRLNPSSITSRKAYIQLGLNIYIRELHQRRMRNRCHDDSTCYDGFSEEELACRIEKIERQANRLALGEKYFRLAALHASRKRFPLVPYYVLLSMLVSQLHARRIFGIVAVKIYVFLWKTISHFYPPNQYKEAESR